MKEQVAEIVAAYLTKNRVDVTQLPALITSVSDALSGLGQEPAPAPASPPTPAVPIRRSVGNDTITCLDCGYQGQMLKRHLASAHSLTPEAYRQRWSLQPDYPMVAKNYASRRSELAKAIGLGTRGGGRSRREAR